MPETMERFRREVLLARRVSHPNVCRVYELYQATTGTGMPVHFLTMEFLDGETLSARLLRKGRMTTAEALPARPADVRRPRGSARRGRHPPGLQE